MATVKIDMEQLRSAKSAMQRLSGAIDNQRHKASAASPIDLPSLGDPTLGRTARYLRDRLPEVQAVIDLGTLLATHGATSASYDSTTTSVADVRRRLGLELARTAKALKGKRTTPGEWKRFGDLLATYAGDREVTKVLFDELGPQGTVQLMHQLEVGMRLRPDDQRAVYAKVAENVRAALAAASRNPAFDSAAFGRGLVESSLAPSARGKEAASILAFLMDDVDYDDRFLTAAVTELDAFERQEGQDPTFWYLHNGVSELNALLTNPPPDGVGADPMAVVMKALGRNTEVGYRFLADPERQRYYFDQRTWKADGYEGVSMAADKIATDLRLLERDPQGVTRLAAAFVHYVTDSDGFDPENAKDASPYVSDLLAFYSPSVAHALRGGGVQDRLPYSAELSTSGLGRQVLPVFSRADLVNLVGVGMSTGEGMTNLAEGLGNLHGTRVAALAAQLEAADHDADDELRSQLKGALEDGARLQGFFQRIAGDVSIDKAKGADAQIATFVSLVSDAIGLAPIPIPGSKLVEEQLGETAEDVYGYAWGKGVDLGTDKVEDWLGGKTGPARRDATANAIEAREMTAFSTYQQLVAAGVLTGHSPAGMPATWDEMQRLKDSGPPGAWDTYKAHAHTELEKFMTYGDLQSAYDSEFVKHFE